jgi:hypothetical protein
MNEVFFKLFSKILDRFIIGVDFIPSQANLSDIYLYLQLDI